MKHILAVILGVATSAVASLFLAAGAGFTAGYVTHFLEAWPWLVSVSVGPCALSALGLSLAVSRTRGSRWRLQLAALFAAYIAVVLAGSLGAVAVESAHRGLENVNVSGYLTWCWIYAAVFLPLSYPLALLVQRMVHRLHYVPGNA
jgi:predicted permease